MDRFLSEIDHDQFREWAAYFAVEPQGWQAWQLGIQVLSYRAAAVPHSTKHKAKNFVIELRPPGNNNAGAVDNARAIAAAIHSHIRANLENGTDVPLPPELRD